MLIFLGGYLWKNANLYFFIFQRENYLTLTASVVGATALIFNAKGNPAGQLLTVVFSILYGIISFTFAYYGEMITYLGMTAPMAVFAFLSWLRNPYGGNRAEVKVNRLKEREPVFMLALTAVITFTTSFLAVYLTFRRSAYFALAYAANDIVLIVLWTLAVLSDISYLSVIVCFIMFLVNDMYGYISWTKMQKRQASG